MYDESFNRNVHRYFNATKLHEMSQVLIDFQLKVNLIDNTNFFIVISAFIFTFKKTFTTHGTLFIPLQQQQQKPNILLPCIRTCVIYSNKCEHCVKDDGTLSFSYYLYVL